MTNIEKLQQAVLDADLDGWLFYDVWGRDPLAYRILSLDPDQLTTRRWAYLVPASDSPVKLVHRIEPNRLASLPGETLSYSRWIEFHEQISEMLEGRDQIAMQYSPNNDLFNISYVDAGTVDLVRSTGTEVVSSADLLQMFVSHIDAAGVESHVRAGAIVHEIKDAAFELIFESIRSGNPVSELDVQEFILTGFSDHSLTCEGLKPVVACNAHAANPHYEVTSSTSARIEDNDRVLIDLWAKVDDSTAIYCDICWCGYAGDDPPKKYAEIFAIVADARNLAKEFLTDRIEGGDRVFGWEVDDVSRSHIERMGYGDYFTHRT